MKRLSLIVTLLLLARLVGAADFFIHDGDRVVFLGDSITEQRFYTTYLETYVLTRFPHWKLTFRNVGWGGDTSWLRMRSHPDEGKLFAAADAEQQAMVTDAVSRGLERDVLPLKPSVVTIDFGMNDHSYQAFRPDIFRAYVRSETELAKVLQQHGARVALLTPQPIEDRRPDPDKDVRNESLKRFSDGLKDVASKEGALYVDQFGPYMAAMLAARAADPTAFIGGGDAVHPGPVGHTIMAWAILKGLGAPALVSQATIDAAAAKVVATAGCQITNLKVADGALSFDRRDDALPWLFAAPAAKLVPVLGDLDRYLLKVTGLTAARYALTIDGEPAASFSREDLAKDANLALADGPLAKQGQQVQQLVVDKNNLFYNRWRAVQLFGFPGWADGPELEPRRAAELARLDQQIAGLEAQIDAARQPKPHHFELKPVAP